MIPRKFQHFLNPLHIYCRFREHGYSISTSRKFCMFYEKWFFILIRVLFTKNGS